MITLFDKNDLESVADVSNEHVNIANIKLKRILEVVKNIGFPVNINYDLNNGWKNSRLIVGHMSKGIIHKAPEYEVRNSFQVVINLTRTRPGWPPQDASHEEISAKDRFVFYCRDVKGILNPQVLRQLYEISRNTAQAIVQGKRSLCPQPLQSILFEQPKRIILPTFLILCQGYLAVYSSEPDIKSQEKNLLDEALKLMGWQELCKNKQAKELIPPFLFLNDTNEKEDESKINKLRQSVSFDSEYWQVLQSEEYVNAARDEWEECVKRGNGYVSSGSDWDSSKLKKLLLAIAAASPPQKSTEICLVAEAYLEVNNCLGGV